MSCLFSYIADLPPHPLISNKVVPFLSEHKIVTSANILANLHTILYVAAAYQLVFVISQWFVFPLLVRWKLSSAGESLEKDNKIYNKEYSSLLNQSAVHFVSLVQSFVILYLSFGSMQSINRSTHPSAGARVFASSRENDIVCIFAVGYFIWDTLISMVYSSFPFVLHGAISTVMFLIGLKPYINFYAPIFLLFELSNPFLNFRWFGIKYFPQLTEANRGLVTKFLNIVQLVNNAVLITMFFLARIFWGWWKIGELCWDFYQIYDQPQFLAPEAGIVVTGNLILDVLNAIWFAKMLSVAKRIISKGGKVQAKDETKKDN